MQAAIRDLLTHLDDLCDQPPRYPIKQYSDKPLVWLSASSSSLERATYRMLEGMWLYWLGNTCLDEVEEFHWKGNQLRASEDEPIGYQLMMLGLATRATGCEIAAQLATPSAMTAIRAKMREGNPAAEELAFRTAIVRWMEILYQQHQSDEDWFGQQLPASIETLTALNAVQEPYKNQGNTSVVTAVELQRQVYFIKRRIEPGHNMTLYRGFQAECFVSALFRASPWPLAPTTTGLFMAADGVLSYLSSKVSGITMTDIRKAASRVSLGSVQAAVLGEHLVNVQDRHHFNVFIDRFHASPRLIDFASALQDDSDELLLPPAEMAMTEQREMFPRALWTWHPERLQTPEGETIILDDVVTGLLSIRQAVFAAFQTFVLPPEDQTVVMRRFAVLERLVAGDRPMTIEQWNRLAMP